jgi:hypothetical protein
MQGRGIDAGEDHLYCVSGIAYKLRETLRSVAGNALCLVDQ